MNMRLETTEIKLHSASAQPLTVKGVARFRVQIEGLVWKYQFVVVENLPFEVIIGAKFMSKTGLVLDYQATEVYFKFRPGCKIAMGNRECEGIAKICASGDPYFQEEVDMEESPYLGYRTEGQQAAIQSLIRDFREVINPRLGLTNVLEYEIQLEETTSVRLPPYRMAPPKMWIMK